MAINDVMRGGDCGAKNILIGFTPYHLIPLTHLVKRVQGAVFVFHPMAHKIAWEIADGVGGFLGGCDQPGRQKYIKYIAAAKELRSLFSKGDRFSLFAPHPYNPISNFTFFSSAVSERYIFQDGILNYYDAQNPFSSLRKKVNRLASAWSLGLPYTFYDGHLSGVQAGTIDGGYFSHPDRVVLASCFKSVFQMVSDDKNAESEWQKKAKNILFLDQPIENVLKGEVVRAVREKARKVLLRLGGAVIYKPHHDQPRNDDAVDGFIQLSGDDAVLPAEFLVEKYKIKCVVSFFSSALVNISLMYPGVRCIAIAAKDVGVKVDGVDTTLAEVMNKLGVEIYDFD